MSPLSFASFALAAILALSLGTGTAVAGDLEAIVLDDLYAQAEPGMESEVEQAEEAESRRPDQAIEEITVTARKREESLMDTPLSVTALGMSDLQDNQVRRLDDISFAVPNLQLSQGYEGGYARVRIRGIGSADPIVTRDPSVGVYLDGVYIARLYGALLAVTDIERVEVLRGPQGTLFGRNTTGGAIQVHTVKPSSELEARAEVRYGNYNNLETRGMLNIPLNDEWAFLRLSFASQTRDETKKNVGPIFGIEPNQGGRLPVTEDADDRKLLAYRAALRLLPTDNLEVMLIADQSRVHQRSRGAHCRYNPDGETGRGFTNGGMPFTSLTTGNYPFLAGLFGFVPNDGGMNNFADYRENCEKSALLDEHEFYSNVTPRTNLDAWGVTGVLNWDISEAVSMKYTGSWRRYIHYQENEYDWTATAEFGHCFFDDEEQDQTSHELTFTGEFQDRLHWSGGLYTFRETFNPHKGTLCRVAQTLTDSWWDNGFAPIVPEENIDDPFPFLFVIGHPAAGATYRQLGCVGGFACPLIPAPFGIGLLLGINDEGINRNFFGFVESNWITNNTYAGYFQATFDVTDQLSLTGGVRRLVEKKEWTHRQDTPGELGWADAIENAFVDEAERFDRWIMLANAQYRWNEDLMTYATFSTGYKSGGFNGRVNEVLPQTLLPFEPEEVYSWEVGVKSSWFDRRLGVNFSAFYTDYEEIQQTVLASAEDGSFASVVENAGEATIRGMELEIRARPLPGLDLSGAFGWTDADYKENKSFNNDGVLEDRRHEEFYNTPQFTMNLAAAYTLETPYGLLTPRVNWYHQTEVSYSPEVHFLTRQDTYGLLSARISLELNDGQTELALWGTNLLDRRFEDNGISFDNGFAVADIFYGQPRFYGIELIRRF